MKVEPLLQMIPDWAGFLRLSSENEVEEIHRHEQTGRPLGKKGFVKKLEKELGRRLIPQKPGPKKQKKVRYTVRTQ